MLISHTCPDVSTTKGPAPPTPRPRTSDPHTLNSQFTTLTAAAATRRAEQPRLPSSSKMLHGNAARFPPGATVYLLAGALEHMTAAEQGELCDELASVRSFDAGTGLWEVAPSRPQFKAGPRIAVFVPFASPSAVTSGMVPSLGTDTITATSATRIARLGGASSDPIRRAHAPLGPGGRVVHPSPDPPDRLHSCHNLATRLRFEPRVG
jgi:hypothetical protein